MGSAKFQKILECMAEEEEATNNSPNDGPNYGAVDENNMLEILNRMNRVVTILKVHIQLDTFS